MSFVRVYVETSDQNISVSEATAIARDLPVIDAPAVDAEGNALPPTRGNGRPVKPRTSPAIEAKKAATKKESE